MIARTVDNSYCPQGIHPQANHNDTTKRAPINKKGYIFMPTVTAKTLWDNHPYPNSPCSTELFANQCAIRMGAALEKSGIDTTSFNTMYPRRRCCSAYPSLKHHKPGHIMAAQELANWIDKNPKIFGKTKR